MKGYQGFPNRMIAALRFEVSRIFAARSRSGSGDRSRGRRVYLSTLAATNGVSAGDRRAWRRALTDAGFTVVPGPDRVDYTAMEARMPTTAATIAILDEATGTAGEVEVRTAGSGRDRGPVTWKAGPLLVWFTDGSSAPWLYEDHVRLPDGRDEAIARAIEILSALPSPT